VYEIKGVATALVTQNRDPEGLCRVRVRYPWHEDARTSHWARLSTPMAGKSRGLVLIPEVGDEVLVAFEREDLRYPFVLGSLWSGQQKPPLANDDGKNDKRILRTRRKHYLLFDDGATGVVELAHQNGAVVKLTDDEILLKDAQGNQVRIASQGGEMTLQAAGPLSIKAATISIEASGTLELKSGGTLSVRGSVVNIN
jgi:uncharacterized protein involved in type VI secretion and phage assembly